MKSLSALHLYGAAGIASFGLVLCHLLGWKAGEFFWVWLAAALLVYNVDRLKNDPADRLNVPLRAMRSEKLRRTSLGVATVGAIGLVVLPIWTKNWLLLALTVSGSVVCCGYSLPVFGTRLKQIPVLKTLLAPSVVLAAWVVPPLLKFGPATHWPDFIGITAWVWGLLLFNMVLCDQRDIDGDRQTGVLSLPAVLGQKGTRRLLLALVVFEVLVGACLAIAEPKRWVWLAALAPLAMTALLLALRKPRGELFYEWWVEGLLFVPLIASALSKLA